MAWAGLLVLGLPLATMGTAQGQSDPTKDVAAEALFRDGLQLLEQGKVHEACEKLAVSQHLDPAPGTLLNLALCHRKEQRLATAWAEFREAVRLSSLANQRAREAFAERNARELEPSLGRLIVDGSALPTNKTLTLDGAPLDPTLLGTAVPLDAGPHTLQATAPHRKPWTMTITTLDDGRTTRIVVPALEPLDEIKPLPAPPPRRPFFTTQRIAGTAVAALGVGSLVVAGLYFDGASRRRNLANEARLDPRPESQAYASAMDEHASSVQTYGWVLGGLGLASLGVGTYLLWTGASASTPSTPSVAAPPKPSLSFGVDVWNPGFRLSGTF